ncbi:MAG: SDR family NAD(P)-dependent oxidoreductase [FCB group bacterium]|nr:SDR family NAD(P)-dependent oxidoreductase [FCB group bacterium]
MKKILVTGGAGFIGSYIVDYLIEAGNEVVIFDNLDPQVHPNGKKPDFLNSNAQFISGDVRDLEALKKAVAGAEQVYHMAAAVGVGQSMYQIAHYVDVNTGGTANLLDVLTNIKNKVEKVVVAASMSSYGEGRYHCSTHGILNPDLRPVSQMQTGDWEVHCPDCGELMSPLPTDEEKPQICNSIYALTKKDQEEMTLMWGKSYDIPTTALRFFNVYGPRQSLSNPYTGVCAIFMSRIKNDNRPVIYEDGLQTRDFISVKDIARACIESMNNSKADHQVFNVGTGKATSINDVAQTLAKIYGKDIEPDITKAFRKGDVRHCISDPSKIEDAIGFRPQADFQSGMEELIKWTENAAAEDHFDKAASELADKGLIVE